MISSALVPNGAFASRPGRVNSELATKPCLIRLLRQLIKLTPLKPSAVTATALALFILAVVLAQPSLAATFARSTSLGTTRMDHTATLLPNGKVLVAGGYDGVAYLASCELYDPATGTWSPTGPMANARGNHTATLLPNGKVLVVTGSTNIHTFNQSAELYDPATGTWSAAGDTLISGRFHTATLLPNGKVLVAGGDVFFHVPISDAMLYDPDTGTWSDTGSMYTARGRHTATLLPNGQVLVAGGMDMMYPFSLLSTNSAELYDPASGTWTATGSMTDPHAFHTATLLPNGRVLVAEGFGYYSYAYDPPTNCVTELYDPVTGSWATTGWPDWPTGSHTATLLPNGQVLTAGGSGGDRMLPYNRANLFDPASGTWAATKSMATARGGHTAILLPNGKVLVAGGWAVPGNYSDGQADWHEPSAPLDSCELYNPSSAELIPGLLELLLLQ